MKSRSSLLCRLWFTIMAVELEALACTALGSLLVASLFPAAAGIACLDGHRGLSRRGDDQDVEGFTYLDSLATKTQEYNVPGDACDRSWDWWLLTCAAMAPLSFLRPQGEPGIPAVELEL